MDYLRNRLHSYKRELLSGGTSFVLYVYPLFSLSFSFYLSFSLSPLFCLIPCFFSLLALSHADLVLAKPFFKTDKDGEREGVGSLVKVPFWCCLPLLVHPSFPKTGKTIKEGHPTTRCLSPFLIRDISGKTHNTQQVIF